jgi:hypothetical protein
VRCYVNVKVDSEIHRVGWLKLPSSAKNTNLVVGVPFGRFASPWHAERIGHIVSGNMKSV